MKESEKYIRNQTAIDQIRKAEKLIDADAKKTGSKRLNDALAHLAKSRQTLIGTGR